MLTISQVSKAFAGRILFEDASLQVNRGDRVGLVGPNGAGKSTLFSLILGEASPDEGKVALEKAATVGFLPQEHAPAGEETVLELACAVSPELVKAQRIMKSTPEDSAEHHEALHSFDEHGGWQLEPKAKRILAGLAFRESDFDRPRESVEWRLGHARASRSFARAGAGPACCSTNRQTISISNRWFGSRNT